MRLLQSTVRSYLIYSGIIVLVAIPLFYLTIKSIVKEDADEHLITARSTVLPGVTKAIKDHGLDNLNFADQDISLSASADQRPFETFTNTDIYDSISQETAPYRVLLTNFRVDGRYYLLRIRNSMLDSDDLIESIVKVQVVLLLVLLTGLLLINRKLSKRIWKPFYSTLEKLREYKVEQHAAPQLPSSSVSEFNDLNRSLRELTQRAHESYRAQKEFTENAAHEIQTPLAIVQSKLELLMQTSPLNEEQAELIGDLANASQRLGRLTRSLILLTRIENQQFPDTETVVLSTVVEKNLANIHLHPKAGEISVERDTLGDPVLQANRSLLEVLVGNLLNNAFRHNHATGLVRVTLMPHQLLIQNTGRPSPLDPQHVFHRFYKESSDSASIGLGLQIVRQISALYGWTAAYDYRDNLHSFSISFG